MNEQLNGKTMLITGGAKRVGKIFALACARAGADVVIHHGHSTEETEATRDEVTTLGRQVWAIKANLNDPAQARNLISLIIESTPLHGLVNSAAIFESISLENTSLNDWQRLRKAFGISSVYFSSLYSPSCLHAKLKGF